ncbi:MAG: hypothetical protein RCO49_10205 [Rickettsia endosymbiont of Argas persicus]
MINFDRDRNGAVLKIKVLDNEDEVQQLLDYLKNNPEITTLDLSFQYGMYGPPVQCKKKIMSIVQKTNAAMYPAYS